MVRFLNILELLSRRILNVVAMWCYSRTLTSWYLMARFDIEFTSKGFVRPRWEASWHSPLKRSENSYTLSRYFFALISIYKQKGSNYNKLCSMWFQLWFIINMLHSVTRYHVAWVHHHYSMIKIMERVVSFIVFCSQTVKKV